MYRRSHDASTTWSSTWLKARCPHADTYGVNLRLWCEHAWLGGPSATDGVVLDVTDDRITGVEMGIAVPPVGAVRLPGLTLPGFVNTHQRSVDRVLRGREHVGVEALRAAIHASITPQLLAGLARAVFAELALAGFTVVGEVVDLHRNQNGSPFAHPMEVSDLLIAAAKQSGVRLALIDMCELAGSPRTRFSSVHDWVQRVDPWFDALGHTSHVRLIGGIGNQTNIDKRALSDIALWSGQCGLSVQARTDGANGQMRALIDSGVITNRGGFSAVGTNGLLPDEITSMGQQRGYLSMEVSPQTMPWSVSALRMSGARVVASVPASTVGDPFVAMRAIGAAAVADPRSGPLATNETFRTLTADGAGALGWRDAGLLASGQLADLVTVSLGSPSLAGIDPDNVLSAVLHYATKADVTHVAMGGELIVQNGRHRLGDVSALMKQAVSGVLTQLTHAHA
jgi:cytosine/adenosine deaminase-related metal-dependent hydrolase